MKACVERIGVALFASILVLEVAVRVADPVVERYRGILFGNDPASLDLFREDVDVGWVLRPDVRLSFVGTIVRTSGLGFRGAPRRAGSREILVLGDSTPFGWRVEEADTFAARLEELLAERSAPSELQVLNGGVPGHSSFQTALLAERFVPWLRPEWVVVHTGINDPKTAIHSDAGFHRNRWGLRAVQRVARQSRLLLWFRELRGSFELPHFHPEGLLGDAVRVSVAELEGNLARIDETARRAGARLLLLVPLADPLRQDLALAPREGWGENGALTRQVSEQRAGEGTLRHAIEKEQAMLRARPAYQRRVKEFARARGIPVVDANPTLAGNSREAIEAFFLDPYHPTPSGHRAIADAIVERMAGGGDFR